MEIIELGAKGYRSYEMGIEVDDGEREKGMLTSFTTIPPNECATKNRGLNSASLDVLTSLRSARRLAAC